MRPALDHLVIAAADLASGQRWLEERLGVPLQPGGEHVLFGTHNALLNMGSAYLEVIAVNPAAAPPTRPRWFSLGTAQMQERLASGPALIHWVAHVPHLETALLSSPEDHGQELPLARGHNRWLLSVPPDGSLPLGGVLPSLIEWQSLSPALHTPDRGVRLKTLQLHTPDPARLAAALAALHIHDETIQLQAGPLRLEATLNVAGREVTLS